MGGENGDPPPPESNYRINKKFGICVIFMTAHSPTGNCLHYPWGIDLKHDPQLTRRMDSGLQGLRWKKQSLVKRNYVSDWIDEQHNLYSHFSFTQCNVQRH